MFFAITFYILTLKHALCDFALQGRLKGDNRKWVLLSRKGLLHAFDHLVGTAIVLTVMNLYLQTNWFIVPLIAVLDFILHLVIDWRKNIIVKHYGWSQNDRQFWVLTSIDQGAHLSCYLLYCWLLYLSV